ncbi:hypothetical protein GCM10028825_42530 [Spirosoma agri]
MLVFVNAGEVMIHQLAAGNGTGSEIGLNGSEVAVVRQKSTVLADRFRLFCFANA